MQEKLAMKINIVLLAVISIVIASYLLHMYTDRTNVQTVTVWGAPILWNGTFDQSYVDRLYAKREVTVGITVFAIGRYLDLLLKNFVDSAELHFFVGYSVTYYVVTDQPSRIPNLLLAPKRMLVPVKVEKRPRWQDICMDRFKIINGLVETTVKEEYVFSFDVDLLFTNRWGPEVLGSTVVVLHSWFFNVDPAMCTYERRPESMAYVATREGDFYYHAAVFGGRRSHIKNVTHNIFQAITKDRSAGIEAIWHDESHLNRYFIDNKPSKILSPEYCWDEEATNAAIKVKRLIWVHKDNNALRENP
uniref:N-acetyllactosaminide alpha-1,3-galactosyltransferase-like n=2 Tax=Petromyzon marinus TaxID=7757 RepID=A0AAJ7SNC1_PETMA|nr:N-acetyllactosaminide alpha-1,3-galactosyltransferase-like [Petromyzon marinus]